jgi:hypothetical protein
MHQPRPCPPRLRKVQPATQTSTSYLRLVTQLFFPLIVALLSLTPSAFAQSTGNFFAGQLISAGPPTQNSNTGFYFGGVLPVQTITGDFNGDGKQDILVGASCAAPYLPNCPGGGSAIAVYLGNGNGTFQSPILSGTLLPPDIRSIAVGDFNHDGKLDVAAAADCLSTQDCSSGTITILLGNGTGSFTQSYSTALNGVVGQAFTLAVGDFNNDGKLDLVAGIECYNINVSGCSVGSVEVFLGDGAGNLAPPSNSATVGNAALIPVVGDFNNDGKLDIVATSTSSLTFVAGNGNGAFQTPVVTPLSFSGGGDTVAADFNSDRKLDLAIVTSGGIQILDGIGNGTFQPPVSYPIGQYLESLAIADLNNDGKPDLLISGGSTSDFSSLLNDGTGNFLTGPSSYLGGWENSSVASADFNGDGKADIVIASFCSETSSFNNNCPDGTLGILLGNGNGTVQAATSLNIAPMVHYSLIADINHDGVPDLVATEDYYQNNGASGQGGVVVALGREDGNYGPATEYPASVQTPTGLALADLRGVGKLDVIVLGYGDTSGELAVLLGGGNGTLGSPATYNLPQFALGAPVIGDFAGSHHPGVAVVNQDSVTPGIGILLGNGDGTLQQEVQTATTEIDPFQLAVGDFNKDGKADVAVIGAFNALGLDSAVTVLLSNGDGTFTVKPDPVIDPSADYLAACSGMPGCIYPASYPSQGAIGASSPQLAPIVTADLNLDGNLDLVIANGCRLNDSSCSNGRMVYFQGLGDGTFNDSFTNVPAQQLSDAVYLGLSVADVNSDGKPDIVATTPTGVAVYLSPFNSGIIYATSPHYDSETPSIAKLNGVGAPFIALSNGSSVDVLYNRFEPTASFSPGSLTFTATNIGAASAPQTVTLSNSGTATLFFSSYGLTGTGASSFSVPSRNCSGSVAAGSSCTFQVVFTPRAQGTLSATLVLYDGAGNSPQQLILQGTGTAPSLNFSPTSLTFPTTAVGTVSAPQTVTVSNTGTGPIVFSYYELTGAGTSSFILSAVTCGGTIAAGSSCTFQVSFDPQSTGSLAATLTVGDNAPNTPQNLQMSGTGH